jgi:hypothetical protein
LFAAPAAPALAQRGPVFELQPGITIYDFVSVPEGTMTNSAFSVRFLDSISDELVVVYAGDCAVFLPYGSTQNTVRNTMPRHCSPGTSFQCSP